MSRKILTAMVACGAALGVLPTAALAQAQGQAESFLPQPSVPVAPNVPATTGAPLERGLSVADRARPELDPLGLRFDGFFFFPRLEVDELYNDNIFATRTGKTSDFITLLSPSFDLRSNFNRNAINLSAGLSQSLYASHSAENTTDGYATASGRLDVDGAHDFHGALNATRSHYDPGSTPNVPGNAAEPVKFNNYSATAGFEQTQLRIGYSADVTAARQEFEAVPRVGGGFIPQDDQNNNYLEAALRGSYEFVPGYQAFVRGAYNLRAYDHAAGNGVPIRDSQGFRIDVGARIDLTGVTFAEVYVGYLDQIYRASSFGTISGVDVGGRLVWNPTQLTSVTLNAARTVQDANTAALAFANGAVVNSPGYLESSVGVRVDHELLRNLLLNANASFVSDDFKGVNATDNYYLAGVGAKYLLNRNLYIGPSYQFQRLNSSGTNAFAPFTRNIIMLRLSTQL